jgi:hypothetical protein
VRAKGYGLRGMWSGSAAQQVTFGTHEPGPGPTGPGLLTGPNTSQPTREDGEDQDGQQDGFGPGHILRGGFAGCRCDLVARRAATSLALIGDSGNIGSAATGRGNESVGNGPENESNDQHHDPPRERVLVHSSPIGSGSGTL